LTGSSDVEAGSIARKKDWGGDENVMDEEEDKDAEVVEEGVNPSTAPLQHFWQPITFFWHVLALQITMM
jgi:hypothetical protein